MGILDKHTPSCSYGGVNFFVRRTRASLPATIRFDKIGTVVERVAPGSTPSRVSTQIITIGLLSNKSLNVWMKPAWRTAMEAKVLQGYQNLVQADGTVTSAMLISVTDIEVLGQTGLDLVACRLEFRGR